MYILAPYTCVWYDETKKYTLKFLNKLAGIKCS